MIQIQFLILPLLQLAILCSASIGSAHVRGQLFCRGKPMAGERVQLWEKNFALFDTLVAQNATDEDGFFSLKGSVNEMIGHPIIYAYFINYCTPGVQTSFMTCGNSIKVFLPNEFITSGKDPKHIFNLDELELSTMKTEQLGMEMLIHFYFGHKECRPL